MTPSLTRPRSRLTRPPSRLTRPPSHGRNRLGMIGALAALMGQLAGCAGERPIASASPAPEQARISIDRALPKTLADRPGWAADLYAGFTVLGVVPSHENVCAVVAVIEQESGFRIDPVVPGLATIAWREIDDRAAHAGVPRLVVHGVLQLKSSTGRSFGDRIDQARTEKELSDVYEDLIGTVPLGRTLFADRNPIRTRGPMQVHVAFAERFAALKPYPYPVQISMADEVFTRRGGLYFGIAHLLAYAAPYDRYIYRFADFNAGQYASRNAAFQQALGSATGIRFAADGALLAHDQENSGAGATAAAARALAVRLGLDSGAALEALQLGKTPEFEHTALYRRTFELGEQNSRRTLPRAVLPDISLHGPKISRRLTTEWYARRVDERFERCVKR